MKTKIASQIFVQDMYISTLDRYRTTRILLPQAYYKFPTRKFPVIYMFDGQNLFDKTTSYSMPWNIKETMDKLPYKQQAIVVGIDNGKNLRAKEYLCPTISRNTGDGHKFIISIIQDLKPKVDIHLRTLSDPKNTYIVGSSLGGLVAFYAATRYSHIFGKAGVLSPSFWLSPDIIYHATDTYAKIYMMGSSTESKSMEFFMHDSYHKLRNIGYPNENLRIVLKKRGKHNEILWGREFKHMIKWLV